MKNSQKPKVNKSEWIRSRPTTIPAKELQLVAKKEGIALSLAQIYTARSAAKKSAGAGPRKPGRPAGKGASKLASSNGQDNEIKVSFVKLAMRIGTDEARRILDRIVDQQQQI